MITRKEMIDYIVENQRPLSEEEIEKLRKEQLEKLRKELEGLSTAALEEVYNEWRNIITD